MSPKLDPTDEEKQLASDNLHAFIKNPGRVGKKEPEKGIVSNANWNRALDRVKRMLDGSLLWSEATALDFVALYAILHKSVYQVEAVELGPTERLHAAGAARRLMKKEFGDVSSLMMFYMRWAWTREEGREKWRRDNNRDGGRLGWKLMFNGSLLTDYRVSAKRRK